MPNIDFLVEDNNGKVLFDNGFKLEILLPEKYFDDEIAIESGLKISTMAVFIMNYYKTEEDTKPIKYRMLLPETITFSFSEQSQIESKDDNGNKEVDRVFTLYEKDTFIENINVPKSDTNTENFVKLHFNGRIPKVVNYSDIIKLYLENMYSNSCDLKVPACLLEVMIAELARDKNNIEVPYRIKINETNKENDYQNITIKTLASITSTFTALTSEDINANIISSVSKTRTGGSEKETPIEKALYY